MFYFPNMYYFLNPARLIAAGFFFFKILMLHYLQRTSWFLLNNHFNSNNCIYKYLEIHNYLSYINIGKRYFSEKESGRKALEDGFNKGEIYVALDNHNS